jgi:hypothetical protein
LSQIVPALRSTFFLLALLVSTAVQAGPAPILVTGEPSPLGLPFSSFANVALMADGRVAFRGSSTGAFERDAGGITHILAAGSVLSDGRVVAGVSAPALGAGGCTAVRVFLVGGGSRILRRCGGAIDVVAAAGEAAPTSGSFAEFVDGVACDSAGHIAFGAVLDDGSFGLFVDFGGVETEAVRTGMAAPSGGTFDDLQLIGVSTNGKVGFLGSVAGGRDGLFIAQSDSVQRVVETGEASPVGSTFRTITGASMNDGASFAFRGDLTEGGTGGVFRVDTSGPVPVVQAIVLEGASVSGSGVTIRALPSSLTPSINAGGTVAFRATLSGGQGGSAIFVAPPGAALQSVVSTRVPTAVGPLVQLRDPVIADDGSLVIPASVTGRGPLLAVMRGGVISPSPLARTGETTDLDSGYARFLFSQASVRDSVENAVFFGTQDGIFVAGSDGSPSTVAVVGGVAPAPLGGTFAGFDTPATDMSGVVAFGVDVKDSNVASRAIVVSGPHGLRVAAESSQRVHGGRLVDFFVSTVDSLTRPDVGPRGQMAFEATLEGGKTPRVLFLRRGRQLQPVAWAKERAPGGGRFDSFGTPAVLRGGDVAFVGQAGTELRMLLRRGSGMRLLARQGSGAPGRLSGRFASFDAPTANDTLVGFRATLEQTGREGIFLASPRALGLLVGSGDPAPSGGTFRAFSSLTLGQAYAAFLGRVSSSQPQPGLYRVRADVVPSADAGPAETQAVALPGAPSPLGGTILDFGSLDANRGDTVAVVVDLAGASARSALFVLDPGATITP